MEQPTKPVVCYWCTTESDKTEPSDPNDMVWIRLPPTKFGGEEWFYFHNSHCMSNFFVKFLNKFFAGDYPLPPTEGNTDAS